MIFKVREEYREEKKKRKKLVAIFFIFSPLSSNQTNPKHPIHKNLNLKLSKSTLKLTNSIIRTWIKEMVFGFMTKNQKEKRNEKKREKFWKMGWNMWQFKTGSFRRWRAKLQVRSCWVETTLPSCVNCNVIGQLQHMTFGVVYNDVWMLERELVQLVVPIRVVEFVDELEGHCWGRAWWGWFRWDWCRLGWQESLRSAKGLTSIYIKNRKIFLLGFLDFFSFKK